MQSLLKHETKDTNFHAFEIQHHELGRVGEGFSRHLIDDICGQQFETGFTHPLTQNVGSKVKFMIAEGRVIKPARIPGFDHLLAFISVRFDRRRNGISGEQEQRMWRFAHDFPAQRQYSRQSTARACIHRGKLIDIIDLQKGHPNRTFALSLCSRRTDNDRRDPREGDGENGDNGNPARS